MGIFGFFKKKETRNTESERKKETNCYNQNLDRLTPSGDIPFGWAAANQYEISKVQTEYSHFLNAWIDAKTKSPKEQYAALRSYIIYMQDLKRTWDSKGECFALYRSQAIFSDKELDNCTLELQQLKDNFDNLEDLYQRDQYIKERILPQIFIIIKENPGILQTLIYKMFPADCKGLISSELYSMSSNGRIVREKSGRTYSLRIE